MSETAFHSINHWCGGEGGHFFHYHLSVQKAAQSSLDDVNIYLPESAHFFKEPEGWTRWFSPFYNDKTRRLFASDAKRLFKQASGKKRIFFLEFFGRRDFALLAKAALFHSKRHDHLWILYRDDLTIRRKKDLSTIRFYSYLLQKRFGKRFLPLTDSEQLADYYEEWFKQRPTVMPIPHTSYTLAKRRATKRLVLFVPAGGRPEQGQDSLQSLSTFPDEAAKQFELYMPGNLVIPPITNGLKLNLRKTYLTTEEYQDAIARSHIFLMPYHADRYKWRTSGPFVEAITLGKMPVVLEGSWLASELRRFDLSELIIDWQNPNFFTHLLEIYQDEKIQSKLLKMTQHYKTYHSQETFSKRLARLIRSVQGHSLQANLLGEAEATAAHA